MSIFSEAVLRLLKRVRISPAYWQRSALVYWLPFVLFYSIFVNIPFWAADRRMGVSLHGWFGLDYLLIGLVALYAWRMLTAALLLLVMTIDLITSICHSYLLSPQECFQNIFEIGQFSGRHLIALGAVLLLAVVTVFISVVFPIAVIQRHFRVPVVTCFIAFVTLVGFCDYTNYLRDTGRLKFFPFLKPRRLDTLSFEANSWSRLSRIPTLQLANIEFIEKNSNVNAHVAFSTRIPSAVNEAISSASITAQKKPQDMPNLVVILVESWGLGQDSALRSALVQPYFQPAILARYRLLQGTAPFYGPTIAGEARELCSSTMGNGITQASVRDLEDCLPRKLRALGYQDIALHGMDGRLYNRWSWYQTIGFQQILFRENFEQQGLPDCIGVFTGICDAALAGWIGQQLEEKSTAPQFVYWVTLNSHLPVSVPSPLKSPASCSITPSLTELPTLCSWYQLVVNVHQSIADLAMANLNRPTVFAIVGDHAPPFSNPDVRGLFSQEVVPYVLLIPHDNRRLIDPSNNLLAGSKRSRTTVPSATFRRAGLRPRAQL